MVGRAAGGGRGGVPALGDVHGWRRDPGRPGEGVPARLPEPPGDAALPPGPEPQDGGAHRGPRQLHRLVRQDG